MEARMDGRLCAVTGANTGIGLAVARGLAQRGAKVLLLCRDPQRGGAALAALRQEHGEGCADLVLVDLASLTSVARAADEILARYDALHVLVNNAAVVVQSRQLTEDGLELTLAVDHIAHFLLTRRLLPLLAASAPARVVTVSSAAHRMGRLDLQDPHFEHRPYRGAQRHAYRQSKLANLLFNAELARRLEGSGVTSNAMHPGIVATEIFRSAPWWARPVVWLIQRFGRTPEEGADTAVYLASAPELASVSGRYFIDRQARTPSRAAQDPALAQALWQWTEAVIAPFDARPALVGEVLAPPA